MVDTAVGFERAGTTGAITGVAEAGVWDRGCAEGVRSCGWVATGMGAVRSVAFAGWPAGDKDPGLATGEAVATGGVRGGGALTSSPPSCCNL